MPMKNKVIGWILLLSFVTRSILACITELNNDEVYYWTYAQKLQWNYFDHPPGIAVLLKAFSVNLFFQQEFFLRLGPIVCAGISTWLIYCIGKKIKNQKTGVVAALLFTASPYCSIIAGMLIVPDAPQLVWWLASVLLMLKIIDPNMRKPKLQRRLLLLGFTIGICMLCKVHAVFLWVGFLLYIVCYQRKLLHNSFLFYAGFISAIIFSPVVYWNISNDFISYRYHSSRVSFFSTVHLDGFFREIAGEFIYNNPVSFIVMIAAIMAIARKQSLTTTAAQRLLLLIAMPMTGVVWLMAVFRDTLPHWTGPAYTTLIPLAAAWLVAVQNNTKQRMIPAPAKWALLFTGSLLLPLFVVIQWFPYNIGNKEKDHLGDGDPTLDMNGFKNFGNRFDSLYNKDFATGQMKSGAFLLSDFWFPAAHIDFYAAQPHKRNFMAVGDINSIHHYAWLNKLRPSLQPGDDAYFITVSNNLHAVPPQLTGRFEKEMPPVNIAQYRSGVVVRYFVIYRLKGCREGFPDDGILY